MSDILDALIDADTEDQELTPVEGLARDISELIDNILLATPLTRMEVAQALAIVNFDVLLGDDGDEDDEDEPDTDLGAGV